jgi:hypothetical protein
MTLMATTSTSIFKRMRLTDAGGKAFRNAFFKGYEKPFRRGFETALQSRFEAAFPLIAGSRILSGYQQFGEKLLQKPLGLLQRIMPRP